MNLNQIKSNHLFRYKHGYRWIDTESIFVSTYNILPFVACENCAEDIEVMNVNTNFISEVNRNVSKPKKKERKYLLLAQVRPDKKFCSETEARIKQCTINMQQDSELHEFRLKRERVLLKREENLISFEKQLHVLQLE